MPKLQYLLPSAEIPKRKPKKPMLLPIPLRDIVVLIGPNLIDFENLIPILFY